MPTLKDILYTFIVWFVDGYKFFERVLLSLGHTWVVEFLSDIFKKGGIILDGPKSYDPQVKKKDFYLQVCNNASLGLGEGYMDGSWEVEDLEEFSYQIFCAELTKDYLHPINRFINYLLFNVVNLQTKKRSWEVGEKHYDLGNELFEAMLDPSMNYSCGYWKNADNLNQAQVDKMELIGKKLKLKPGMKVLDIGCGWGGLCKYLAENFDVQVVGCTISAEQGKIARERCADLPIEIRLTDYRDIDEKFDRIVSVGMFEHVGTKNYRTFFEVANRCLTDDGIFLLHTIGVSHKYVPLIEPWFHKYIFPNGILPYYTEIPKYIEDLFIIEDWHNFGPDYHKTLRAWIDNFKKSWPRFEHKAGQKFYRMWMYYLSMSSGAFRSRKYQLWQVVLSKNGLIGGYESVR